MTPETTFTLALVAAGIALASAGAVRLSGAGLRAMPRRVALASVGAGGVVVAFGIVGPWILTGSGPSGAEPTPIPRLELEPVTPPPDTTRPPAEGRGTVRGTVRHAEGQPVAGATVMLRRYEATTPAETTERLTDAEGDFLFESLPTAPTDAYILSTTYGSAEFASDVIVLSAEADRTVDLVVAPTTQRPQVVAIELDSMLITGDRAGLQVLQILRLRVEGAEAFAGGLILPVLEGASGFEPRRGLSRQMLRFDDADRLISDAPVLPGTTEIVYGYLLPSPAGRAALVRETVYPTERLELLSAGDVIVSADDLREAGEVPIGADEGAARRLTAHDLAPGRIVRVSIRINQPSAWPRAAAIGLGVAVAVAIVAFPLVRRRRPPGATQHPAIVEQA